MVQRYDFFYSAIIWGVFFNEKGIAIGVYADFVLWDRIKIAIFVLPHRMLFLRLPFQADLHSPLLAVVGINQVVAGAEGVAVGVGGDAVFDADVPVRGDVVARH